jgi:hypothetical protein
MLGSQVVPLWGCSSPVRQDPQHDGQTVMVNHDNVVLLSFSKGGGVKFWLPASAAARDASHPGRVASCGLTPQQDAVGHRRYIGQLQRKERAFGGYRAHRDDREVEDAAVCCS